jgi:ferredoxin
MPPHSTGGALAITIDRHRCVGSGQCALALPAVFDQEDESGIAVVLAGSPVVELHESVREAANRCPVRAILLAEG